MSTKQFRQIGSVVGLAIGDAIGAPYEFTRGPNLVTGYSSGGPFGLAAGEWTDDTSMALCLADSLLSGKLNLADQLDRYVSWWRDGVNSHTGTCFDIGCTTRTSLASYLNTGEVVAPCGSRSLGNGSIMRLAPIAVVASQRYDTSTIEGLCNASQLCGWSSVSTHSAFECVRCCQVLGMVLAVFFDGGSVESKLFCDAMQCLEVLCPGPGVALVGEVTGPVSGRALTTLQAAWWCVETTDSFAAAVCKAASLGGDTDSVGAVAGQIAGAKYGVDAIPSDLVSGLVWSDRLLSVGMELTRWGGEIRNP